MPASTARATARSRSAGVPLTINPPTSPHPNPSADTRSPVRPSTRCCIDTLPAPEYYTDSLTPVPPAASLAPMGDLDFDRVIDRRATDSNKWRKFPADVLPLWVADMDFPSPPVVVRALRDRVEHGFFGYLTERNDLPEVVAERVAKRYGWRVSPEAVVTLPGVIAGFNQALRALTNPGDGLLIQTPVYPPILRSAGNHGLRRDEHALTRAGDGRYGVDLAAFAAAIGD